jgi:hypothetical protein
MDMLVPAPILRPASRPSATHTCWACGQEANLAHCSWALCLCSPFAELSAATPEAEEGISTAEGLDVAHRPPSLKLEDTVSETGVVSTLRRGREAPPHFVESLRKRLVQGLAAMEMKWQGWNETVTWLQIGNRVYWARDCVAQIVVSERRGLHSRPMPWRPDALYSPEALFFLMFPVHISGRGWVNPRA